MSKNGNLLVSLKRGIVNLVSEEELLNKLSRKKSLRIKLGVDPTSPDLHLGHTVLLHKLRLFQEYGHKIVFIVGDFTGRIGDPSGRDETRPMLTEKEIMNNAKVYQKQVFKILDSKGVELVYNSSWLKKLFSDDTSVLMKNLFGRYTVQQMLEREDFTKRRQENKPITLLELMYPLFQAYDSVVIKSDIELGGNDQLFNLLMGRELQRDFGQEPQVVLTLPLLVGTDGVNKMSKSYNNYIALNDTPKDIFGKIMSISDEIMHTYYELLTTYDMDEIKKEIKSNPRDTKAKLAYEITARYHGQNSARKSLEEFDRVFSKKKVPDDLQKFSPKKRIYDLVDLIVDSGLAPSKNEARRLISQGAVVIKNRVVKDIKETVTLDGDYVIQVGKRRFCLIEKYSKIKE